LNGSLAATGSGTGDAVVSGTFYPNIGHLQYSSTYHGLYVTNGTLIDSVNLWPKEISADEVNQLFNGGNGTQYPYSSQTLPSITNQLGVDNGTLMNGCTFADGKIGKAFTFDGVNDYVALPDNSLNFTGDFSVSAWIYVSNVSGEKYIISNSNGNIFDVNTGWCFGVFDNKVSFWVYPGTSSFTGWLTNTTLSLNTWHHVSVTKKPSQSPLLYINGVLSSTSLYNNNMSNSLNPVYSTATYPNTKASIGVYRYNNGSSAYAYWNGKIDGLSVWQKELTQTEVTELYNSGNGKQITATPIITNGLVLNLDASRKSSYPNTGTTWTDISGNGNNGTLTNGVGYTASNGGVMTFDGINDYVSLPDSSTLQPSNITISTWFKINQYGTNYVYGNANACLIRKGMYGYEISVRQDGKLLVFAYSDTNNQNQYLIDSVNPNTWYNVVLTFGNSQMKVYINNSLVGTYATSTNSIVYGGGGISIGRQGPWDMYYFNGNIGQTMVYNRALNSTEISQNFNATKSRFGL
jgi:hypothetical protein